MNGISMTVKCPVCKEVHYLDLGITGYIDYEGKDLTSVKCSCGSIFYFDLNGEIRPVGSHGNHRVNTDIDSKLVNLIEAQINYCVSQGFDLYKTIDCIRDFMRIYSSAEWLDKFNPELTAYVEYQVNKRINEDVQVGILYEDLDQTKIKEGGVICY